MLDKDTEKLWNEMVEYGIATDAEIGLVCAINGTHKESLLDILYVRTGYRNMEQFFEEDRSWE